MRVQRTAHSAAHAVDPPPKVDFGSHFLPSKRQVISSRSVVLHTSGNRPRLRLLYLSLISAVRRGPRPGTFLQYREEIVASLLPGTEVFTVSAPSFLIRGTVPKREEKEDPSDL